MLGFPQDDPLAEYRWKKRIVLVFEPVNATDEVIWQITKLADQPVELADRDMLVLRIDQTAVVNVLTEQRLAQNPMVMRAAFDVPSDAFATLLIGKDGGIKMISQEVVEAAVLFGLIDSMPMRQSEMRRNKGSNR